MKKYSKLMAILLVFAMILAGVAQAAPVVEAEEVNSNVIRLSGADRIKTSVKISQTAYKDGAESVVIVGYEGEVDALAGTLLAHAKKGPVLFTKKGKLSEDTKTEIARLGAKNVYILGGTATIEDAVKTELETLKYTVKRISGSNREGTAAAVAKEVGGKTTHVFLARGYGDLRAVLSDALAVGPASAKGNMAVLLTRTDKVPAATLKSMKDLGVTNVTIVGGEVAVNSGVKTELETLKYTVDRLSGTTREGTAIAIANKYFAGKANALVANGYGSPDALVGGYLGAAIDAPILFSQANKVSEVTTDYLKANTEKAWILGGERVVNKEVLNKVLGAVVPTPTPPSTGGGSGGGSGDNVAVNTISVDKEELTLKVGDSGNITATVEPDNAANKDVTWESSDEAVATVDASGKVTGIKGGTATITVTSVADSSKKATVQVIVGDLLVPAGGSIQDVINEATTGQVIAVAQGIYEEQLTISKEITLLGPNAGKTGDAEDREAEAIIKGVDTGISQLVELEAENVVIKGFTFDNTRIDNYYDNTGGTKTNLIGGISIENNIFRKVKGTAIYLRDYRNAPGSYSENVNILNNKIEDITAAGGVDYNAGSGIIVMGAENLKISGNTISNPSYNGIQIARNKTSTISGNIVSGSQQPALQIAQWNEGEHDISGNTFSTYSTEKGAIRLYGFTENYEPKFNITRNTIEDSSYGIQIGHGDAGKSYNDISKAKYTLSDNSFNEISENELIIYLNQEPSDGDVAEMNSLFKEVYGEEYSSRAKTNKDPFTYVVNILKVGEGKKFTTIQAAIDVATAGDTILVGDGDYKEELTINKAITLKSLNGRESTEIAGTITITADDVTVEGFTVTAQGYYAVPVIHMIDIDNVNILNNTVVADDTAYGAIGTSSAPAKITGKISGNTVTGMIMVGTDGAVEVSNNNVTLTTASTEGICFYPVGPAAEITVTENTVGQVTGDNVHIKVNEKPLSVNGKTNEVDMLAAIKADNAGATAQLSWVKQ